MKFNNIIGKCKNIIKNNKKKRRQSETLIFIHKICRHSALDAKSIFIVWIPNLVCPPCQATRLDDAGQGGLRGVFKSNFPFHSYMRDHVKL